MVFVNATPLSTLIIHILHLNDWLTPKKSIKYLIVLDNI